MHCTGHNVGTPESLALGLSGRTFVVSDVGVVTRQRVCQTDTWSLRSIQVTTGCRLRVCGCVAADKWMSLEKQPKQSKAKKFQLRYRL